MRMLLIQPAQADQADRDRLVGLLGDLPVASRVAVSAADGLALLASEPCEAALLAGVSAASVLEDLRQLVAAHPELAVLIVGSGDLLNAREDALNAGAQELFVIEDRRSGELPLAVQGAVLRQRQLVRMRRESEQRYHELFALDRALLCTHQLDGSLISINPAACEQLGFSADELIGRKLEALAPEPARAAVRDYLARLTQMDSDSGVLQVLTRAGHIRHWEYRKRVIRPPNLPAYVLGSALDVTERRQLERLAREHALRDPLTHCYNRRFLTQYYGEPSADQAWGCIVADVDQFHALNERYGHQRGDDVLLAMARFLGYHARRSDAVVRLGGDQFLLLLADADEVTTQAVAQRLKQESARAAPCSFSLGVAVREGNEALEKSIDRANHHLDSIRVASREGERRHPPI